MESCSQIDEACSIIKGYFHNQDVEIMHNKGNPANFFDIDDVINKTAQAIHLLGIHPSRIVIDVTGGTKIASIAGMLVAVQRGTMFQYVQTQHPHKILGFQVGLRLPEVPA